LLNNQILGFGHYYKFANCKRVFRELDAFIRMRLRRYIARNKDSKRKENNLILTNKALSCRGLKSLTEICPVRNYPHKNTLISQKSSKKKKKTDYRKKQPRFTDLEQKGITTNKN